MRIFVIHNYLLSRLGLCTLLQLDHSIDIIGHARYEGGLKFLELIRSLNPDILLWQLERIENDKLDFINSLLERCPAVKILIMTDPESNGISCKEILKRGVIDCVSPNISLNVLFKTISKMRFNNFDDDSIPNNSTTNGQQAYMQLKFQTPRDLLTPQEMRIAALISQGYSNLKIADTLYISLRTVEVHVHNIFKKLKVKNRVQAVATATRMGIVLPETKEPFSS
ncbi:MAG: response regulator transcription factor [Anaerolineales bacterium]|nr:response regulator transcription factor [Anaerolineales bacterium]